jgi:hypothetical protein
VTPSAFAPVIAFFSRDRSVGDSPSMLSSEYFLSSARVDLVGVFFGFGVSAGLAFFTGALLRTTGAGGGEPLGAPATTGCLSSPESKDSKSATCECQISNEATRARPVTDSNRAGTEKGRRGRRWSVMGYSLSGRRVRHIGPRDRLW